MIGGASAIALNAQSVRELVRDYQGYLKSFDGIKARLASLKEEAAAKIQGLDVNQNGFRDLMKRELLSSEELLSSKDLLSSGEGLSSGQESWGKDIKESLTGIYRYLIYSDHEGAVEDLLQEHSSSIKAALALLGDYGVFSGLFSSSGKKKEMQDSFDYLYGGLKTTCIQMISGAKETLGELEKVTWEEVSRHFASHGEEYKSFFEANNTGFGREKPLEEIEEVLSSVKELRSGLMPGEDFDGALLQALREKIIAACDGDTRFSQLMRHELSFTELNLGWDGEVYDTLALFYRIIQAESLADQARKYLDAHAYKGNLCQISLEQVNPWDWFFGEEKDKAYARESLIFLRDTFLPGGRELVKGMDSFLDMDNQMERGTVKAHFLHHSGEYSALYEKYRSFWGELESLSDIDVLYKDFRELLSALKGSGETIDKALNEALSFIGNVLPKSKDLSSHMRAELVGGEIPHEITGDVVGLIEGIHGYFKAREGFKKCADLASAYAEVEEESLPLLNPMGWFLESAQEKHHDASLVHGIVKFKNEALSALEGTGGASLLPEAYQEAREEMGEHLADYKAFWEEHRKDLKDLPKLPELEKLLKRAGLIQENLSAIRPEVVRREEAVKAAIESLAMASGENKARHTSLGSLEEVNEFQEVLLREAGFESLGDIYAATGEELLRVNGISREEMEGLRAAAQEMVEKAKARFKIQVDARKRSRGITEVIRAIYDYLRYLEPVEKGLEADERFHEEFSRWYEILKGCPDEVGWVFTLQEDKEEYAMAYRALENILPAYDSLLNPLSLLPVFQEPVSENEAWQDFEGNPGAYFLVIEKLCPGVLGEGGSGLPEDLEEEVKAQVIFPEGLTCKLRGYQEWGVKYILHQKNVLLGDEMGLGKTVQAIATMVSLGNVGATHFLVVCPASVIPGWSREIAAKSKLKVFKVHGSKKLGELDAWQREGGVAVTSYQSLNLFLLYSEVRISLMVADEAHFIKNPKAGRSIQLKRIAGDADRILFMTGTAIENRVGEMVELISYLRPDIAGELSHYSSLEDAQEFRRLVAPVYYRRKREDVLTELPDLIKKDEWCVLGPKEQLSYEKSLQSGNHMSVRRVSFNADSWKDSSKAARLKALVEEARDAGRRVVVFSFFLDTIQMIKEMLGDVCYGPITGGITPEKRQEFIDEFSQGEGGSVLLCQILAGGTGLNIQSASVVILCEPQLKPSLEDQAISRAYRMNQKSNVLVYRLLAEGTVDEKMVAMLAQKQKLFDEFADQSVAAQEIGSEALSISEADYGKLILEEIERIKNKAGRKSLSQSLFMEGEIETDSEEEE